MNMWKWFCRKHPHEHLVNGQCQICNPQITRWSPSWSRMKREPKEDEEQPDLFNQVDKSKVPR